MSLPFFITSCDVIYRLRPPVHTAGRGRGRARVLLQPVQPWVQPRWATLRSSRRALYSAMSGHSLLMEELLSQDVCVPAMLGEFAQHVQIHPAQRERSAPVTAENVVQPQR